MQNNFMQGFKKQIQPQGSAVPSEESQKIHIMPGKFQLSGPKKGNKLFLILILLLVILFITLVGLAVLYKSAWSQPAGIVNNVNIAPIENINTNTDTNIDANVNLDTSDSPSPSPSAEALDFSDLDNDGLTGEEEKIFSTNANSPDTDSDGYRDEEEILLGYDPRWKDKNLEGSDLVNVYNFLDVDLLYPVSWQATDNGLIASFDTKKSDVITFTQTSFEQNMDRADLMNVIQIDDPMIFESDLEETKTKNYETVYKTNNGLKYYFFSNDLRKMLILSYEPADIQSPIYLSVFQMMANSLTL